MTPDDILVLAKAGFSADQIAALASVTKTQPAAAATNPAPAPATAPEQTPAPAPAAAPPAAPAPTPAAQQPDQTAEILRKLGVLTDAIQSSAIVQSTQPQQQSADDILAEIVRPPKKGDT